MSKMPGGAYLFGAIIYCGIITLGYAAEDLSRDADRIVVIRNKGWRAAYSLEADALEDYPSDSVLEMFSLLPVDLQSRSLSSGIQSDFSLRGSNFQEVLVLVDGQRVNDPQTAHFNSDIPLTREDIETVQVMPGVGSSLFGPDAIGGAINCVLKKPGDKKIVSELSGGSFGRYRGLFSASEKFGRGALRLSLEKQADSGFRYDTDSERFTANMTASYAIAAGELNTFFGYDDKEFGAYDFYTPGLGFPSWEETQTYLFNAGLEAETPSFQIKPNILWRRHYDSFMLDKTRIRSSYLNHSRTDICTPSIYIEKQTGPMDKIGALFEYGQERIDSANLGKHSRAHQSLALDQSDPPGNRVSHLFSFRFDNFDSFGEVFSGSAHFYYNAAPVHTFKLGVTRTTRIPSFTELYYSDPTTMGDPGLDPETAIGFEAGYDYCRGKTRFGVTLFTRDESKTIDWVKHQASDVFWRSENIGRALAWGAENYAETDLNKWMHGGINYTYVGKHNRERNLLYKYGENYASHLVNAYLVLRLPCGDQRIGLSYKKKPHRRGWTIVEALLNRNLTPNCRLFLKIDNLLNVEYQEIEGIPQPGRAIESGLRFEW